MLLKSGKSVIMLLILSVVMIILQNVVGSGVMALMGKDPLYGLACGSISMIGGPGTAAGIGPDLDAAGAIGGTTVAVAAATFGLIFGSLLGGPIARKLIVKNHLRNELAEQTVEEDVDDTHYNTHANNFVYGFLLLMFCAGVGNVVSVLLTNLCGFSFPIYIGSMLVAVVVRNVIDHFKIMEFPAAEISTMGNMFLAIFLSMALSGLKLWLARRPGAADDRRPRRRGAADGRLLAAGRLPGHGPRLRRRDDHRRLHRLRHGAPRPTPWPTCRPFPAATVPLPRPTSSSRWSAASSTTSSTLRSLHSVSVFLRENRLRAQSPSKRAER